MPINNPQKPQVEGSVLRPANRWKTLLFYQKANTLFQLTVVFCERFLPKYGDRTVDQMIQAARSGKQNIIEGSEDGKTSTEMELKLLNVARSSIGELQEDFVDYIQRKHLPLWDKAHPRYNAMRSFTQKYNHLEDYEPYFSKWNDEEMANIGLTLCHQVDYMMNKYLQSLEKLFVTQGGIKEHRLPKGARRRTSKTCRRKRNSSRPTRNHPKRSSPTAQTHRKERLIMPKQA